MYLIERVKTTAMKYESNKMIYFHAYIYSKIDIQNWHGINDTRFQDALLKWSTLIIIFLPFLVQWDLTRNAVVIMKPIRTNAPNEETQQSRPVVLQLTYNDFCGMQLVIPVWYT